MKYNPCSQDYEQCVVISNMEFAELVKMQEQIEIIKRLVKQDQYFTVSELKIILGVEENETV